MIAFQEEASVLYWNQNMQAFATREVIETQMLSAN